MADWTPTFEHCDSSWGHFTEHSCNVLSPIWGIWRGFWAEKCRFLRLLYFVNRRKRQPDDKTGAAIGAILARHRTTMAQGD
jgi:hypothetical protein